MKRIVFATHNETNYQNAKRYLDAQKISVVQYSSLETNEISIDLQDTVTRKAKAAYQKVQ